MKTRYVLILALCAAGWAGVLAKPVASQDRTNARPQPGQGAPVGDMLGTMNHGLYQCALPGSAEADAFVDQPEESFRIGQGSSYESASGCGVYLLRGTTLTFTRGPKKDERFRRLGSNTLQAIQPDGTLGRLICTRLGGVD